MAKFMSSHEKQIVIWNARKYGECSTRRENIISKNMTSTPELPRKETFKCSSFSFSLQATKEQQLGHSWQNLPFFQLPHFMDAEGWWNGGRAVGLRIIRILFLLCSASSGLQAHKVELPKRKERPCLSGQWLGGKANLTTGSGCTTAPSFKEAPERNILLRRHTQLKEVRARKRSY